MEYNKCFWSELPTLPLSHAIGVKHVLLYRPLWETTGVCVCVSLFQSHERLLAEGERKLPGSASGSAVWGGGSLECQPHRWSLTWGSVWKISRQKSKECQYTVNTYRQMPAFYRDSHCDAQASKRKKQHNSSSVQSVAPQWGYLLFKVVLRLS